MGEYEFGSELQVAVFNSEWSNFSPRQRKTIIDAVEQSSDDGKVTTWHMPSNTMNSKAFQRYVYWENHSWYVTQEARDLVNYIKDRNTIPQWYYLRQYSKRGIVSLLQTRDIVLAERLAGEGWESIEKGIYLSNSRHLHEAYLDQRSTVVAP